MQDRARDRAAEDVPGPSASRRRRLFFQLSSAAWPRRGLSPLNLLVLAVILAATMAAILATEPVVLEGRERWFDAAEIGFGIFFLAEYAARLWTAPEEDPGQPAWRQRLRFMVSPSGLFDLLAIVSTLLPFIGGNATVLRLVRLLRILRLAKLGRMSGALRNLNTAVASRRYELTATVGLALMVLVFGATALYWIEGPLQPDKFGSIPRALWWAVITLTTIGYGDVYPITALGKFAAGVVAIAGIGLIAMPTGILASAFSEACQQDTR